MRNLALVIALLVLWCSVANAGPKMFRAGKLADRSIIVDYGHHETHEGNHYITNMNATLASGAKIQMLMNTPSLPKRVHFLCLHRSTGEAHIEIWRSPTVSSLGTVVTPDNRDDAKGDNSGVEMHHTPTVTNAGTEIPGFGDHFGAGQTRGGESRGDHEVMLRPNTLYLINAVSEAANNDVTVGADFYVDSGDAP